MTTVSDAFEAPTATHVSSEGAGARARVRARLAVTKRDGKIVRRIVPVASAVRADVAGAWVWRGSAPTPYELWQRRIPDLETVPGQSKALWGAWVAYNHLALVVLTAAYIPLWVLEHPARTLLAAIVAAPIVLIWTVG